MSQTTRAREVLTQYPLATDGRYNAASQLMQELGITRNHARVLVNRAMSQPKPRGGARVGGGRKPKNAS